MDSDIDTRLVGIWATDPEDAEGIREYGETTLDFTPDGQLTYRIHLKDEEQIIYLTFRAHDGILTTNQPSAPEERTRYSIGADGKLSLWFGGQRSLYVRTAVRDQGTTKMV